MITPAYAEYLEKATGAMSRGDLLNALQFALQAAHVPRGQEHVRCDAYMLLALTSLEMRMDVEALTFAVGAHLAAHYAGDRQRQEKAAGIVSLVVTEFPQLNHAVPDDTFH